MKTPRSDPPSDEQPYPRRRRAPAPGAPVRPERDFWRHFDLEKFAKGWLRGTGKPGA